jgi:transposase
VTQEELIAAEVPIEKFSLLSKEDLIVYLRLEQDFRLKLQHENSRLKKLNDELKQQSLYLQEQYVTIKNELFGKSSERRPARGADQESSDSGSNNQKEKKVRVLLPSERYPDAQLIERRVTLEQMPNCRCCGAEMSDSGMTEDSEFLTVIPKQYIVIRLMRHKYRCTCCHGDLVTAPAPPRIKEGSAYSDEMTVDVAMTKYCDLVPIERYSKMAEREGIRGLPPQSLIESTHYLADYVRPAYEGLKEEILKSKVLHADETPHRMLEGDKKSQWFLWGFSSESASYFECHPTRSGDVASSLLTNSDCEFLVSDVFSGYGKAVRETNVTRQTRGSPKIHHVYCNAHARRRFWEASEAFPDEAEFYLKQYDEIYRLDREVRQKPPDEAVALRRQMIPLYEAMRDRAIFDTGGCSSKSGLGRALSYFLSNFAELTRFTTDPALPIDNNPQERLLRNPVIGRKTWYGTHSKQGAETAAILFSLVESCKLNKVNPREYTKALVSVLHAGQPPFTPKEYKRRLAATSSSA